MPVKQGKIYLVGAGPGDPDLITVKGLKRLREAEVVFYDHLVHPDLLQEAPSAQLRYVGKVGYGDQVAQMQIQEQLAQAATEHSVVVRLKGGDPFLFGRGGEEAEFLSSRGIPFEVIPGVTSALAVPAYAGIPLTHRELGSTMAVVTGHHAAGVLDWEALSRMDTLVILMGLKNLKKNFSQLLKFKKDSQCPAAAISWGTYPFQKTLVGTLESLPEQVASGGMNSPAVIVVGAVVKLRKNLAWLEQRPLFGKKILITRSRTQASELKDPLESLGAWVVELPTLELHPPKDWGSVDRACNRLARYDWILFSSVNGVEAFLGRLRDLGRDLRALGGIKIAAVGAATARALERAGLRADLVPETFTTDVLAERLSEGNDLQGKRILFPRALEAREAILTTLRDQGAEVEVVPVYRAKVPDYTPEQLENIFSQPRVDLLTFASSSTVKNFVTLFGETHHWSQLRQIPCVVIGPVTRETAVASGLNVKAMADPHTVSGLVEAVLQASRL